MKTDLISILIPFYNDEKYINDCMDSVLNQDYENIEVIAIDDGSSDNTLNILKEYAKKDKRVKCITQDNSGVSKTRNNALSIANGKYVCLVDQDDTIDRDYISYFYKLIIDNDAEIALTPQPFKFNSNIIKNANDNHDAIKVITGEEATKQMLYYNFVIAPWNKMISMDLIKKNKIAFNTKLYGGEGFKFSIDCFKKATKVALGNRKVYNYRCDNAESGMTRFRMAIVDSSIYAQKLISEEIGDSEELVNACKYANWHTYTDLYNSFVGCKVIKQYNEKYKEIKKVVKKDALLSLKAPINRKEKIKGILYAINPYITAKIINKLRVRKFTTEE
nr:glycosyltransferase family 2 protein [Bacilli bacterium]